MLLPPCAEKAFFRECLFPFCQSKGLNDPFTGGISGYGLTLMVAFALLQRDHFPPSPAGSSLIQQSSPTPTEDQAYVEELETVRPRSLSSVQKRGSDRNDSPVPPSPGQVDSLSSSLNEGPTRKELEPSVDRQRFWHRSSLSGDGSTNTGVVRFTKDVKETGSRSSWDR